MDILKCINEYIEPIYEQHSKEILSRISYNIYKKILEINTNQKYICENRLYLYIEYNESIKKIIELKTIDFGKTNINDYSIIHKYSNGNTYAQLHSLEEILETLIFNENNKNVFIPIILTDVEKNVGHICLLIFDNSLNIVYFFDPNGFTSFNNNDNNDKIFNEYIMLLNNIYYKKYSYITQNEWLTKQFNLNNYEISLNNSFNNIDSGHCMCITLIISHLLSKSDKDINSIISILNNLTNTEKIDIIMGYTQNVYNIIHLYHSEDILEIEKNYFIHKKDINEKEINKNIIVDDLNFDELRFIYS